MACVYRSDCFLACYAGEENSIHGHFLVYGAVGIARPLYSFVPLRVPQMIRGLVTSRCHHPRPSTQFEKENISTTWVTFCVSGELFVVGHTKMQGCLSLQPAKDKLVFVFDWFQVRRVSLCNKRIIEGGAVTFGQNRQ